MTAFSSAFWHTRRILKRGIVNAIWMNALLTMFRKKICKGNSKGYEWISINQLPLTFCPFNKLWKASKAKSSAIVQLVTTINLCGRGCLGGPMPPPPYTHLEPSLIKPQRAQKIGKSSSLIIRNASGFSPGLLPPTAKALESIRSRKRKKTLFCVGVEML